MFICACDYWVVIKETYTPRGFGFADFETVEQAMELYNAFGNIRALCIVYSYEANFAVNTIIYLLKVNLMLKMPRFHLWSLQALP